MSPLGEALYARRMDKRHGQREAGQLIGVSGAAYGKWESGESVPSAKHMQAVASYLEVPVETAASLARGQHPAGRSDADLQRLLDLALDRLEALEARFNGLREEMRKQQEAIVRQQGALIELLQERKGQPGRRSPR